MPNDLLPCPFCGRPAEHYTQKDESLWSHDIVDWHYIGCPACDYSLRQCEGYDQVLAKWNRRPNNA